MPSKDLVRKAGLEHIDVSTWEAAHSRLITALDASSPITKKNKGGFFYNKGTVLIQRPCNMVSLLQSEDAFETLRIPPHALSSTKLIFLQPPPKTAFGRMLAEKRGKLAEYRKGRQDLTAPRKVLPSFRIFCFRSALQLENRLRGWLKKNYLCLPSARLVPLENEEAGAHLPTFQPRKEGGMRTSDIYHTQGIHGFQAVKTSYAGGVVRVKLVADPARRPMCPICDSFDVAPREIGFRDIIGLKAGTKQVVFEVPVFRLDCLDCPANQREELPFVEKWARHTRAVSRSIVELRRMMSISDVAKWLGLDWRTVKEVERRHLATKFKRIRLRDVRIIGIDEIHVGDKLYKTIVRDLESGAVLFVGDGKGGDALAPFERRLRKVKRRIKAIAMDMSTGYSAWARRFLPESEIVFDHFHLVKLMNEKLDIIRRRTVGSLDEETRKQLKQKRRLFLRNEEDLKFDERVELEKLKETFGDLGAAHALKEKLRSVYRHADNERDARPLLVDWAKLAEASGIGPIQSMAKTVITHLGGILGYWKFDALTSAGMEGFNNKIRWLIHQAYGFHDQEYFDLKIYDLPNCTTTKEL
jgi:transposase